MTEADHTIRVLLVDDHTAVRLGYHDLATVSDHITIIGSATSGEDALARAHELHPHVVLMDIQMDGIGGIRAIQRLRTEIPDTAVIVVSGFHNTSLILEAINAGAAGYLTKEMSLRLTASTIEIIAAGGSAFGPKATPVILDLLRNSTQRPFNLSTKERTIIGYLSEGLTEREIGQRMNIDRHTVQNYISAIRGKLNAHERADIIQIARNNGLL